jgi:curved DNA-binding protein CbpA
VSEDDSKSKTEEDPMVDRVTARSTHYDLLDLSPDSSVQDIRRAYREKSKLFHPDTTQMPLAIAQDRFHQLNEAYAILISPERRSRYDLKIGHSKISGVQSAPALGKHRGDPWARSVLDIDPSDRPLSPGELFALFILGLTFIACLLLAVFVGLAHGESMLNNAKLNNTKPPLFSPAPFRSQPASPPPRDRNSTLPFHFFSPSSLYIAPLP